MHEIFFITLHFMTRQSGTTAAEKWKHHEEGDCPMIGIGIGSSFSSKAGPHKVY
jgi:hypothetical protein